MAISETITDVILTNTFDEWRSKTNQVVKVLGENLDTDPVSSLVSTDSAGALSVNTISVTGVLTGANVTGTRLLFSGSPEIDFTGATVTDLGTSAKWALVETVGATVTGASPDSKIERCQINECEINLNGKNFSANGSSTITFSGATVTDLGTVETVTLNEGTINDVNVNITDSSKIISITAGDHVLTGATFGNGTFNNAVSVGGLTHSANISINASSAIVANVGAIFGSDVENANVGIGHFPEYTHLTGPKQPTSSQGRLHIRTEFAAASDASTAVDAFANELVLENGNTDVGMTLLSNTESNCVIAFGDTADTDIGFVSYDHTNDRMMIGANAANAFMVDSEFGSSVQIPGTRTLGTQKGKLHVNVGSTDATAGIFLDTNDEDQVGINIEAKQTSGNVINITANSFTTGHVISIGRSANGTGDSTAANGSLIHLTDNNSSTNARAILDIVQNTTGASGSLGLRITTEGGEGIQLLQNSERTAMNVESSNAHSTSLAIFRSADTGSTGATLSVTGNTSTGATKIMHVANNDGDIFRTYANGNLWCTGAILSDNGVDTVNARLPVRDTGGTVVNTT